MNPSTSDVLRCAPWMLEAMRLIGTREVAGPRHNSAVIRMWESIRAPFRDDETPWCAGYVGHCLESVRIRSTRSAAALSYRAWGSPVIGAWRAAYGAVVVLKRPGSNWSGHVGFLTGYDGEAEVFQLLSGNSDNRVQFAEYPAARLAAADAVRWPSGWPTINQLRCPEFKARGARARTDA